MSPALLVLTALTAQTPAPPAARHFAIVVGTNAPPDDSRRDLRFADDDAARYHQLFTQSGAASYLLTAFDGESQQVYPDLVPVALRPTRANFERVAAKVRAEIEAANDDEIETVLYFYYAGHGQLIDGEGSITLLDSILTRSEFRATLLANTPATLTHVIIDACKSYFFVAGRGALRREQYAQPFAGPEVRDGVGYVLSTSNDADSHEWAAFGGGIVSHEVRSALVGGADADNSGSVDYSELAAFVTVANEAVPVARYRPRIYIQPPRNNRRAAVFEPARVKRATRLDIDAPKAGRVIVHDARGLRYADVHKSADHPVRLMLQAPFPYRVEWGDHTYLVRGSASAPVRLSSLPGTATSTAVTSRGDLHAAFTHLFSTPFDRDVVRGFTLAEDRVEAMLQSLPPPERSAWPPVLVGTGAAAVGVGILMTVLGHQAELDARTGPQADRPDANDRAARFEAGAAAAYTVGAAAIITGIVLYFVED